MSNPKCLHFLPLSVKERYPSVSKRSVDKLRAIKMMCVGNGEGYLSVKRRRKGRAHEERRECEVRQKMRKKDSSVREPG